MKFINVIGKGCVTAFGDNVSTYLNSLSNAMNQMGEWHSKKEIHRIVDEGKEQLQVLKKTYPYLDRTCYYILKSVDEALKDANMDLQSMSDTSRVAIIIGTTYNCIQTQEDFLQRLVKEKVASPLLFKYTANNLVSGVVAQKFGIHGYNTTISNGWTSGIDSFILGANLIYNNQADYVIVGGVDLLTPSILIHYEEQVKEGLLTSQFSPGEGCAVVILSSKQSENTTILRRSGMSSFYSSKQVAERIESIVQSEIRIDHYYGNFNHSIIDPMEHKALHGKKISNIIDIKSLIGECGAATGLLQLIASMQSTNEISCIMSVCLMGHISYLMVENDGNKKL